MNVKIDTKEKFTVITPIQAEISANMTDELSRMLLDYQNKLIPHVVMNMANVQIVDAGIGNVLYNVHESFQLKGQSFVICCLSEAFTQLLADLDILDYLNITPTESEAWDIIQMEEIEREMMKDFDSGESK